MSTSDEDAAFQAFTAQAIKCEAFASSDPKAYRTRVAGLAALGYVFAPVMLVTLLAMCAAFIWAALESRSGFVSGLAGKLVIAMVLLTGVVARAMWPSFGSPDGLRIRKSAFPELYSFLEDVQKNAGNPKVDRVYVTDEMNAAVSQTPRLGLFGWYRNDLILGLPLIQTLSRQELAAVLAHEFGHLSGEHGRLGAWVYRTRAVMSRILNTIERKKYFGSWMFLRFYRWYAPYFAAYSFALAREQEFEADRMAASVTSPQVIIDALVRVSAGDDYMGRVYWGEVWDEAGSRPAPPENVYNGLGERLRSVCDWDETQSTFEAMLERKTDHSDTHPSLSDRAEAVGVIPRLPSTAEERAVSILPDIGAGLAEELSKLWQAMVVENWSDRHNEIEGQRAQLVDLDAAAETGILSEDDAMTRGYLAEEFLGAEAALSRFEQAVEWSNGADRALFAKGRLLLELGRDDGLVCLEQVMDRNADAIVPGCQLAQSYLMRAERTEEAADYERRKEAQESILQDDWVDRNQVNRDDEFVSFDGDPEKVADIRQSIRKLKRKGLKRAWLARKVTQHRQWDNMYVLVCDTTWRRRWSEDTDALQTKLAQALEHHDDVVVLVCDVGDSWLRDKARAVPDAKIFPKK